MEDTPTWFQPPTIQHVRSVIKEARAPFDVEKRDTERIELTVPATIQTLRGNTVAAMTLNISRYGIGLLHRGIITPQEVTLRMNSESKEYVYRVDLLWSEISSNGMCRSGGRFLGKPT